MLTYNSLFDEVTSDDLKRFYAYKGSVNQVLEELKTELPKSTLIYHPTRIIKALIDYKITHPHQTVIHDLIRYMVEFTKEIYSIHSVQIFKLTSFKLMLLQHDLKDFLESEVVQEEDAAACLSSIGRLTQKTAQKIFSQTSGKNILILPMAHGATAAGIDLFLRYCDLSQNNFSTVYPCRFSAHKEKDKIPQLNEKEISYLISESKNKEIVLFEENVVTGNTLKTVNAYLTATIFSGKTLFPVTNLDISKGKTGEERMRGNHEEVLKQFLLEYEDSSTSPRSLPSRDAVTKSDDFVTS